MCYVCTKLNILNMKRFNFIYCLLAILLLVGCSIDRKEEPVVIQGIDGKNSIATQTRFNGQLEGSGCENGGIRIDIGLDLNEDGVLQAEEVQTSNFVCNGIDGEDGQSSLFKLIAINGSEECPNGGVQVQTGFDLNGNKELDDSEIAYYEFICNGTNGTDGEDGLQSLINTESIEEGDLCDEGGFLFKSGLDLDGNGTLEENEVTREEVVCNGEDGLSVLYNVTVLDETESCPTGGLLIETGLDANENGNLDQDEVANTNFICNGLNGIDGTNGFNSLVSTEEVENGVIIRSGLDINRNNILDSNEVMSTSTILNGNDGQDGEDGTDGFNSLVSLEQLGVSSQFPTGGVKISTGLDLNRNNVLDTQEISNIAFIANGRNGNDGQDGEDGSDGTNGQNGLNSLVRILEDTPNNTSTTIQVGIDDNNNGVLEDNEVDSSTIIEDGEDGTDGQDGEDGRNGKCSFVVVVDEPAGENCEFGGVKIITGKDDNDNKVFDEDEIDHTEYVCEYRPCVTVEEIETVFDFEVFNLGDIIDSYRGVSISGYRSSFNGNQFMIFDSNNPTGGDFDLGVNQGKIAVISEDNDSEDVDDNASGGVINFVFNKSVTFNSVDIIDLGGNHNYITFIYEDGSNERLELERSGEGQVRTIIYNKESVVQVVLSVCESFGLDNVKFKCKEIVNTCDY